MDEIIICNESRPGIEILELQGSQGYGQEHLIVSNGLSNGLRLDIMKDRDDDEDEPSSGDWWCFHIKSPETAKLIAAKLLEWSDRIADPPSV